jgi:hypothetical protein
MPARLPEQQTQKLEITNITPKKTSLENFIVP